MVIKSIIGPVQAWLLASGKCVGCGMPLSRGKIINQKNGTQKIICKCGRIFIKEKDGKYRRALFEEV
ncbi:hypothetical protein A2160_00800 [Candidatus Beckwithbacteria bacterium RBG_13_42_9]|uniref:Uncharacterized protein n=1 Tax=Candidatus Beckwithbacteria bacterium RBG_13_42_9 TaxID=1797457 RepID=A0A1F5E3B1_9BACT|nr:MAG: hypothetical protein A2160_00800 [Candidatus Beckwithbacteria bacterium RBG_13_42_9]